MTKRKDPNKDSRFQSGRTRKRKRRTPEELAEARRRGENIRDQSGGNRRRAIKVDGKFLSAEDRGVDKRFSDINRQLKNVTDELKIKDDLRRSTRDKLETLKSNMFAKAKKNNNVLDSDMQNKVSKLEQQLAELNKKVDSLRSEQSKLKVRSEESRRSMRNFNKIFR